MNIDRFKFRIWDINNQRYGLSPYTRRYSVDENVTILELPSSGNFIIEQCTGVKDKNGKLIFEGDIVSTRKQGDVGMNFKVEWNDGGWYIIVCDFNGSEFFYCGEKFDIIGNIHQNPELMK